MALIINKSVDILGDINIDQIYSRVIVSYGPSGTKLIINVDNYHSKESYDNNRYDNKIKISGIPASLAFDYDRDVDSHDILLFGHVQVKNYLTTDTYGEVPVIDPSTGEIVIDPSTGLQETEIAVIKDRFAMDTSVNIIDI